MSTTTTAQLNVWENSRSVWVIATSAEEAADLYRADRIKHNREIDDDEFRLAAGPFEMYYEDAHDENDACPMTGPIETASDTCGKCSPSLTREQLIECVGPGGIVFEYGCG